MPPDQAPAGQSQQSGVPPSDDQGPLTQIIVQTDQALTGITKVLAKASPEAAKAMAQVNEQFRQIIQSVMNQGQQGGGGQQPASPMVSPETRGKPSMQAY